MTNKEAIKVLEQMKDGFVAVHNGNPVMWGFSDYGVQAFDMAINALKQVTFQDLSKPNIEVLKEHHKVCDDCDGFIYDYCSECPIRNKNKDDDAS